MTAITAEQVRAAFPTGYRDQPYEGDRVDLYDYEKLVTLYGLPVLYEWEEPYYQGDGVFILQGEDGRIGLMVYGFGSCSGCDALQACSTTQDVADLANEMFEGTRWFDDKEAMRAFIDDPESKLNDWWMNDRAITKVIRNWIDGIPNADDTGGES
jgi:hypothetical protein